MNLRQNQKGFTIVELLIVIVVIAILAAISIVAYTGIQNRARNSAAVQLAQQIAGKADAYHAVRGTYPSMPAHFADSTVEEADLGANTKVTLATGTAPAAFPIATNFHASTGAGSLTEFRNGNRVIYNGSDNGYVITYRNGDGTDTTITKGTAPTGTYTIQENRNPGT